MSLSPGSRLGPYEITGPLGEGGMGVVYRATDSKLKREVAIKVLPEAFAADAERLARFEREAQLLAQLQHPNIASIYGLEEAGGVRALVMELVEGEDLSERLKRGALPLEEVLAVARQIAEALEAAHEKGIVHRDLKPGNVKLTPEGKVKVLDFGLAKAMDAPPGSASAADLARSPTLMNSPTMTAAQGTQLGVILGTAAYMSPEQARGGTVDKRADIWAFGVVLHEMLCGRQLFAADTVSDTLAGVLKNEIDLAKLPPATPPAVRLLLRRCLERNPKNRLRDVGEARLALSGLEAGEAGEAPVAPATPERARRRERVAWGLLAAALVALVATLGFVKATTESPRVVRTTLLPPEKADFDHVAGAMALSPDGRRIAFVARTDDGKTMLWVRPLDALSAQPLAGTENATFPFWSPDSRFLGFFSAGKLRKIDANGGPPQVLCPAASGRGGAWTRDGTILFTPSQTDPIFRVPAAGGTATAVTSLDAKSGELSHRFPEILPDGERFLFLMESAEKPDDPASGFALWAGSLASQERTRLLATNSSARYSKTGHLLFLRDRTLVAQRFDATSTRLEGEAVPVADGLSRTGRWEATFSLSHTGLLAFQARSGEDLSRLVLLDRDGRELGTVGKPANYRELALSHDARRVAVVVPDASTQKDDIWLLDRERGTSTRLTFDPEDEHSPLWSPDDRYVYFTSRRQGGGDVFRKLSSGIGADELVFADAEWTLLRSLTGDGTTGALMTRAVSTKTGWDIQLLNLADKKATVLLQTPFLEIFPMLTRDGKWMAYQANESGRSEVYVQRLDGEGGKWRISTDGGTKPRWSRGERELVFQTPDNKLWAVDIELGTTFSASVPRPFLDPGIRQGTGYQYDVSGDGSLVLVNRAVVQEAAPVTLVQNWTEALPK
jgi:eukaryotic-like serine/threonine-protein kinase